MAMTVVFVYNMDSGSMQDNSDMAAKIMSPHVDRCGLFKITHNPLGQRVEWTSLVSGLKSPCRFQCRDEFLSAYPDTPDPIFPAVYIEDEGVLVRIADAYAIYTCETPRGLVELIEAECQAHRHERRSQGS